MSSREAPFFLVVGEGTYEWYEQALLKAFPRNTGQFFYGKYFTGTKSKRLCPLSLWRRLEMRFAFGPINYWINWRLRQDIRRLSPTHVLFFNTRHIMHSTLRLIKRQNPSVKLFLYMHDNPYSEHPIKNYWSNLRPQHDLFDGVLTSHSQILDRLSRDFSAKVTFVPLYFVPWLHHPLSADKARIALQSDVVFVGHYEDDGRLDFLEDLASTGILLRVFGPNWSHLLKSKQVSESLRRAIAGLPVYGARYREAISGAKIAISFLSGLNGNLHTTRNFEIPAMRVAQLAQFSEELGNFFTPGRDIEFFRTPEEFTLKAMMLLSNKAHREQIAESGFNKVWQLEVSSGDAALKLLASMTEDTRFQNSPGGQSA